jgi:hypothetical protein
MGRGASTLGNQQIFEEGQALPPGVHLQWALPDALGNARALDEDGENLEFPAVPDLWLVLRWSEPSATSGRAYAAWVIDSHAGTAVTLEQWSTSATTGPRPRLTAVGFLSPEGHVRERDETSPVWAAYYPVTGKRFGFYDPVTRVGPLSYAVVGWYSSLKDDPLHEAGDKAARREFVEESRWALTDPGDRILVDIEGLIPPAELEAIAESLGGPLGPGGGGPVIDGPGPGGPDVDGPGFDGLPPGSTPTHRLAMARRSRVRGRAAAGPVEAVASALGFSVEATYPDHIVCHGAVVGVALPGVDAPFDSPEAGPPAPEDPSVAVASTIAEVTAPLVATPSLAPWVEAIHEGYLRELRTADGLLRVPALLHQASFDAYPDPRPDPRCYLDIEDREPVAAVFTEPRRFGGPIADTSLISPSEITGNRVEIRDRRSNSRFTLLPRSSSGLSGASFVGGRGVLVDATHLRDLNLTYFRTGSVLTPARVEPLLAGASSLHPLLKLRCIDEPRPRWWLPDPPVLVIRNGKRSYRHGFDGRFEQAGTPAVPSLKCRVEGLTVAVARVRVSGIPGDLWIHASEIIGDGPDRSALPSVVEEIVRESAVLDPTNAARMAHAALAKENLTVSSALINAVVEAFTVEGTYWWAQARAVELTAKITAQTSFGGGLPSTIAVQPWKKPWNPLLVECSARFHPAQPPRVDLKEAWTLEGIEHEARPGALSAPVAPVDFEARLVPTAVPAQSLARSLKKLTEVRDLVGSSFDQLNVASDGVDRLDLMSCALGQLDEALVDAGYDVRAGALEMLRVRLVDSFGQAVELQPAGLELSDDEPEAPAGTVVLPPRMPNLGRLMFRLLAGDSEEPQEASSQATSVCGFLLPDHIDHALEVFDANGISLGQLIHTPGKQQSVAWEPAPGLEPPVGFQPGSSHTALVKNEYLRQFVQGLLDWNLHQPDTENGAEPSESALAAVLRVIDTVRHTVNPEGDTQEYLSTVLGSPVALVRAQVTLETLPAEIEDELTEDAVATQVADRPAPLGLEARLGSLTQTDDGLFGYYLHGDWAHIRVPEAEVVKQSARESGAHRGYLAEVAEDVTEAPDAKLLRPIEHPVVEDGTIDLQANRPQELYLLMDPRAGVYATCGVLPRKRIALDRNQVGDALAAMAPTFKVGPVLMNAKRTQLPLPALDQFEWEWTRRERPAGSSSSWTVREAAPSSDASGLPDPDARIQEGWLRLKREET